MDAIRVIVGKSVSSIKPSANQRVKAAALGNQPFPFNFILSDHFHIVAIWRISAFVQPGPMLVPSLKNTCQTMPPLYLREARSVRPLVTIDFWLLMVVGWLERREARTGVARWREKSQQFFAPRLSSSARK